jgi:hypothetical protein
LAEPVAAERGLAHLGREGGPERVTVEEVVKGGVRDRPCGFVIDGAAGRGGELREVERRVSPLPAVVDQAPHDAVILPGFRRGRDGEQEALLALAGAGGHGLERVVGDDVKLVNDGERGVPSLQGTRVGRERHEHARGPGFEQVVFEHLHPGRKCGVELNHPGGRGEDDARLPFITRHDKDLGALYPVAEQAIEAERRGQGRFPVPGRNGDEGLARAGLVQHPGDDLALPGPQAEGPPGPGALRHRHIALDEPHSTGPTLARVPAEVERRCSDTSLRSSPHGSIPASWPRPTQQPTPRELPSSS